MRPLVAVPFAVLCQLAVFGCSTEEECKLVASDGKTYKCDSSAVEKCDQIISTYCQKASGCSWFLSEDACLDTVGLMIECADAAAVTDDYSVCLGDIDSSECGFLGTSSLPASCQGAILVSADSGNGNDEPDTGFWNRTWTVTGVSVEVAGSNADGDAWDAFGGAPDLFFDFYVDDELVDGSWVLEDTTAGFWESPVDSFTVGSNSEVVIKIFDEDLAANDYIGEITISGSNLRSMLADGQFHRDGPSARIGSIDISVTAQ